MVVITIEVYILQKISVLRFFYGRVFSIGSLKILLLKNQCSVYLLQVLFKNGMSV